MTATTPTAVLVPLQPVFTDAERLSRSPASWRATGA